MNLSRIKIICTVLLLALAVGIGFFSVSTMKHNRATLLTFNAAPAIPYPHSKDYRKCEEALKEGDLAQARSIIGHGKANAKDSDDYYMYVVLEAKYHFATMQADSFVDTNRRLTRYLNSLNDVSTPVRQLLKMETKMQRGVYEAKMVGRMDSAIAYYHQALDIVNNVPRLDGYRLMVLTNLADAYKQKGWYDETVRHFRHAMDLGDSIGMADDTRLTIAIGLASAYSSMRGFNESKEWWQQAKELRPKMDRYELFQYLNNLGNYYYLQEKYDESLKCFLELDSLMANDSTMVWERMFGQANLSDVYLKLGQKEQAVALLDKTQPFFTQQRQMLPLYYLITQRIELAVGERRYNEAQRLIDENPTPDWMIPDQKLLRNKILIQYYKETEQWLNYGKTLREYAIMKDSITDISTRMRFSETLIHYQHERAILNKQKEIDEARLSYRWAISLFIASVIVVMLLMVIIALTHRHHRLKDAEMRGSIAELRMETVRNRITPHFISNALSAEIMAQMEGRQTDLDSLVQLLHRGIALTDIEQTTLTEELEFIRFYCDIESRSVGDDFCLHIDLPDGLDTDKVVLPSMSIQILVENAIKHGLKPQQPEPGRQRCVWVKVSEKEGATLVEVIDNGVGLAEDRQNKERTGLRVMRQTILLLNEQNKGKYRKQLMSYGLENYTQADGQHGCRAWLLLPSDFNYILKRKKSLPPRNKQFLTWKTDAS